MAIDEWRTSAVEGTRTGWRSMLAVILAVGLGLLAVFLILRATGVDPRLAATDPDDIAKAPAFYGGMALFGFGVWGAGAGAAFVGAIAARGGPDPYGMGRMLVQAGLITAFLAIDDMYQLHENGFQYLHIPQKVVILAYVVIVVVWAWANRVAIRATEFPIAVVGLGFFALSVLLDQEVLGISRGPFFEDTPKIIGICLWALWLMRSAIRLVRSQRDASATEAAAV